MAWRRPGAKPLSEPMLVFIFFIQISLTLFQTGHKPSPETTTTNDAKGNEITTIHSVCICIQIWTPMTNLIWKERMNIYEVMCLPKCIFLQCKYSSTLPQMIYQPGPYGRDHSECGFSQWEDVLLCKLCSKQATNHDLKQWQAMITKVSIWCHMASLAHNENNPFSMHMYTDTDPMTNLIWKERINDYQVTCLPKCIFSTMQIW